MALLSLLFAMALFSLVEKGARWWRRPLVYDVAGWLAHPALVAASLWAASALVRPLVSIPPLAQLGLALVLSDFFAYAIHRVYHRVPFLWRFHAVHHSSAPVDWLSTSRLHPLSQTVNSFVTGAILFALGLPLATVMTANAILGTVAIFAHAGVGWSYGPLGWLIVSPVFHRRHHVRAGGNHYNFGGALAVWDQLFGTASHTTEVGELGAEDAPRPTPWALLMYPFRSTVD